ncbi:MAG: glycoside hydrolase family 97 catalytic domain-containing protein, partial [Mariniphaga sp.]|nr:glycoside hydrolase family 97 catalytic domain-containing protein [Mariniphaga sp.]
RSAAQRKLMVNFHGCSKPTGLERAYPNIMNYEAVKGAEGNKWSEEITPDHDLDIVFIRQICGPMDYTPGAMRNFTKGRYQVPYPPGSQGTRCHQLAMYVVFPQPLVMLNDMPTAYAREPEYFNILKSIPVNWDETRVIAAEAGEYVVVAKRKDNIWYLGAMTNWNQREVDVDLSFLGTGTYHVTRVIDGVNANKIATDYRILQDKTDRCKTITMNLKQGGGAFYRFTPEN